MFIDWVLNNRSFVKSLIRNDLTNELRQLFRSVNPFGIQLVLIRPQNPMICQF